MTIDKVKYENIIKEIDELHKGINSMFKKIRKLRKSLNPLKPTKCGKHMPEIRQERNARASIAIMEYDNGTTKTQIARMLNLSHSTIDGYIHRELRKRRKERILRGEIEEE